MTSEARRFHIDGDTARVDLSGVDYVVNVMLVPAVTVGQYVLVHAGFAIQLLDAPEAAEILALIEEAATATGGDV